MADAVSRLELVLSPGSESGEVAENQADSGRSVSKTHLVNRLNYLNFQDRTVLVSLRHEVYDDAISLRARPLPCAGERLDLVWAEIPSLKQLLKTYRFEYLLIADGRKYLVVNSELLSMCEEGLSLLLPAACREFQARKIKRHPAREISVQLIQHGVTLDCRLVDFTPVSVRVTGSIGSPEPLMWVNTESPVHLRLLREGEVIYSGNFAIHSREVSGKNCSFVLRQLQSNIQRYRTKKYRNARQQLLPSPNIVFEHPLIDKRVNLKMADISGTGFAVEEGEGDSVLMAGMMLPDLKISFAHGFSLKCLAQVVSRNAAGGDEEGSVRCGLAILDMEIHDHVRLLSILHQVANRKSYVSAEVDLDELWDFFFETGFIYPGKYAHFQANKESIKETYAKLYTQNPQIARHFIYLDRGVILGHLAMVRFYPNSWLIHHHAARKSVSIKAGLAVLDQVSRYLNELESFAFAHLRYVYCYYRPDNKFPSRVFGGFAKTHQDQSSCSLDLFAYAFHRATRAHAGLPEPWELAHSSRFDVAELARFYRHVSGGVMMQAFGLYPGEADPEELAREYRTLGFRKELHLYSLRKSGSLKAFFLVNCTDAGFNMAELTNCVTVMVLDEKVPPDFIKSCLEEIGRHYEGTGMPVLTYPFSYVERNALPYDKVYLLWVLDLQYSDGYLEYCEGLFRTGKKGA
ncbi:pilus biosynthesis protein PilZ [Geoanaerobacter pelophilus]|uniref:Pilus biosynthesis protein PilZ n=1 Tax=Geoanaerobacter pelophilus TaxID=60036 RepID=A0ABQ0MJR3_9BACT|nr:pilus assembly protein PilZ [Geoanaerobacter pelophilus]GAW66406.1 pilus biosynthesis protein PilZ [Geoanaerobacter pelophilus]